MKIRSKILIISIVLLITVIIGSLVIQYFFKNRSENQLNAALEQVNSGNPLSVEENNIIKRLVSGESIYYPNLSNDGKELVYFSNDKNNFVIANLDTKKSLLPMPFEKIDKILDITWLANNKIALVKSAKENLEEGTATQEYSIYDLNNKKRISLTNFNNGLIINDSQFIYQNSEDGALYLSDYEQQNPEVLIRFNNPEDALKIVFISTNSQFLYYLYPAQGSDKYSLHRFEYANREDKIITENINATLSDKSGTKILCVNYDNDKSSFFILDKDLNKKDLNMPDATISQFLWNQNGTKLYYVNSSLETYGQGLSYLLLKEILIINPDNLSTEKTINIADKGQYGSSNIVLAPDDSKIYFVNPSDLGFYSINLQ